MKLELFIFYMITYLVCITEVQLRLLPLLQQRIGAAVSSKYGKKRASNMSSTVVSVNNTHIETGLEDSRSKRLRRWLNSWIF